VDSGELGRLPNQEFRVGETANLTLAALGADTSDVALCDWKMPGLAGRAWYRRLLELCPGLAGRAFLKHGHRSSPRRCIRPARYRLAKAPEPQTMAAGR
jgi:hypothetical protein